MDTMYDVIIVGAGPAGGAAAFFLGQAGKNVLVLEKEHLPRYKTCGGGLPANLLAMFPFSFDPVMESRVKYISYAYKQHVVTMPVQDSQVRMVMRQDFDSFLMAHAKAEVRQGNTIRKVEELADSVIVTDKNGVTYEGRYLIAADGANSIVARQLGLRRDKQLAAAIEAEVTVTPEVMMRFTGRPLFIFGDIRPGYAWIFPKADHLSVGIGAFHPKPGELQAKLKIVMARYGIPMDGVPTRGHPIPIYTGRHRVMGKRTLLTGDAAGLVDPFSGEGIRFAVKSGKMAAEAILSGNLDGYPRRINREIGLSHNFGIGLALLFYNLPALCFLLGVRNPFATQAFVDLLADRLNYPEVILGIFGTLPLFLATELVAAVASWLGGPARGERIRAAVYPR